MLIGLLAGGFALVLLVVGGAGYYVLSTDHKITTPRSAGGMTLDILATGKYDDAYEEMQRVIRSTIAPADGDWVRGVYRDGDLGFLLIGYTGGYEQRDGLVSKLDFHLRNSLSLGEADVSVRIWEIDDAGGDGEAFCGRVTTTVRSSSYAHSSICAWATRTTFAVVLPLGVKVAGQDRAEPPEYKVEGLQRVMRDLRADVES
ncbi:hypothetical protein DMH08_15635 [Actinomadura sp. WAC 06369]|uniref:hypothetical protein n=1 Tax=Actinomadura rifamycini TaxID=31962 RepID=UPI00040EBEAB|nr:hypothetical protein [Actinomadura rifamycini]RSN66822.1 hypothetical protein DMH08_15635 [Actinomadura sp. WAC 06369]